MQLALQQPATVTSPSPPPPPYQHENDWLEPDKEEFEHCGQNSETGAEITLHVDVVFELTLIPASCSLQGFTGLANKRLMQQGGQKPPTAF